MRRARWLIVAAILIIVASVGVTYFARLAKMAKEAPAPPVPLRSGLEATAEAWKFRKTDDNKKGPNGEPCPIMEVTAKEFQQVKEPSSFELGGVNLKHFRDCGKTFDQVKSAKASFDTSSGALYSEGEVEIAMGIRPDEPEKYRLVKIVSSKVHYETKTGKASTDQPATFTFEKGSGKAVGADYDPAERQLHMRSKVELNWNGRGPKSPPLKVETDDLVYHEQLKVVSLEPWARLTRGVTRVEGGKSFVTIDKDVIRKVESENARGVQDEPARKVEYSAAHLLMEFNDDGQVQKVVGDNDAHLVSTSPKGATDVRSQRIELALKATDKESVLEKAIASGKAVVESKPAVRDNARPPDTRILESEMIEVRMREGGHEIDNVETHAPGTLRLIPSRPGPKRTLNGEKFWIVYGAENQIQSFRSVKSNTRTENPPRNGKPVPPVITSSDEFKAEFDPKTNQIARLEQSTNFRYQQGDRKAQSDKAHLDEKTDQITLTGNARVSDPTGGANADRIDINQKTSDFVADGHVTSTRVPDKKDKSSAMLSNTEPFQAKANRMISKDNNLQIQYEGNAVAWQGANRIQADRIEIDRDEEVMRAKGSVISQFVDKPKKGKDGKPAPATPQNIFTVVRAPEMVYSDEDRLAHYTGGVVLTRPDMNVKSSEIKAYLNDSESDSSLDRALADGSVVIVQSRPGRTVTGTSEHAEYYAQENRIVLTGGQPQFVDTVKGTTKGEKLTYFANNDRLLVNGVEAKRAESVILRK